MLIEIVLFCVTAFLAYVLYKILNVDQKYYERRNLKYQTLAGNWLNIFKIIRNKGTLVDGAEYAYNLFPTEPIYGVVFSHPQYIVRDPEIIKQITIKDFDYFEDRSIFGNTEIDEMWGNSLLLMKGPKWRHMRPTLSPAFTGSKMRQMYELVSECAEDFIKHLKGRVENGEQLNVEMKDLFTRYTNDVIASCAFGFKMNSLTDPTNEFYLEAKKVSNFSTVSVIVKMIVMMIVPTFAQLLGLKLTDSRRLKSIVLGAMEYRKQNNISCPDMINILMRIREGNFHDKNDDQSKESHDGFATAEESELGSVVANQNWSDNEIVAQCFVFLIAGFETTSSELTFAAYELVANQDIQQKLYEEICEMDKQLGGKKVGYDDLQKMKYLDRFVSEVLRKWPPFLMPDRKCVKDYVLDNGKGIKFNVEKGSVLALPVFCIHRDEKYYKNPEKFDPERFNDENKKNILPGTYMPFGIGPRNCIGSRFALMEIKAILYYLLLNFSLEVNAKTDIPLKLKKAPITLDMENGMNVELKPRSK